MAISAGGALKGANTKISIQPKTSTNNPAIKQTSKSQSKSNNNEAEETFLDSAENAGPSAAVSGSHEAQVGAELSRFKQALATGYLGKDFMEGLADPAPYVAMSQQKQQAEQALGGAGQGGGGGDLGNLFSGWKDQGATNESEINDPGGSIGEGVQEAENNNQSQNT